MEQLRRLLQKSLDTTAELGPEIRVAYGWVYRAAHLLSNEQNLTSTALKEQNEQLLNTMKQHPSTSPSLDQMVAMFGRVTASYWPYLFHCYDIPDLPRTYNGMEYMFGSVRHQERRVTGRTGASPGLVVRGAVCLAAAVATKDVAFTAADLRPMDLKKWRELRADLGIIWIVTERGHGSGVSSFTALLVQGGYLAAAGDDRFVVTTGWDQGWSVRFFQVSSLRRRRNQDGTLCPDADTDRRSRPFPGLVVPGSAHDTRSSSAPAPTSPPVRCASVRHERHPRWRCY